MPRQSLLRSGAALPHHLATRQVRSQAAGKACRTSKTRYLLVMPTETTGVATKIEKESFEQTRKRARELLLAGTENKLCLARSDEAERLIREAQDLADRPGLETLHALASYRLAHLLMRRAKD